MEMVCAHLFLPPAAGHVSSDGTSHALSSANVCAGATGHSPQLSQCQLPTGPLVGSLVILPASSTILNNR